MPRVMMIGDPIDKVRTPDILTRLYATDGFDMDVHARGVATGETDQVCFDMRNDLDLVGLLITMPHKNAFAGIVDDLTSTARTLGSINCARREASGRWLGAQFDGTGLTGALDNAGVSLQSARVLLMGAGGAGLAIADALSRQQIDRLDIFELDGERRRSARRILRNRSAVSVVDCPTGKASYDVVINATPLGMDASDPSPIDVETLRDGCVVADIVADPAETTLVRDATAAGIRVITGRDMVEAQAPLIYAFLTRQISSETEIRAPRQ